MQLPDLARVAVQEGVVFWIGKGLSNRVQVVHVGPSAAADRPGD
jgi:hypothetical protein